MAKKESNIKDPLLEEKKVLSFGKYLKTEREKKGLSLENIYQISKIQVHYLEALEADRYDDLPVSVLIRGYIRTIAEAIHLSPEETVKRYDNYLKQLEQVDKEVEERKKAAIKPLDIPLERNFTIALAATIGIGIIFTMIYFLLPDAPTNIRTHNSSTTLEESATTTIDEETLAPVVGQDEETVAVPEVQEEAIEPIPEVTTPEAAVKPQEPETTIENPATVVTPLNGSDGINYVLKFYILDESWIKVKIDQEEPRNFMLRNETTATFYAKEEIVVDIGRVSATELIVNGVNIQIPQPKSDVIKGLIINEETVKAFVKREKLLDRSKAVAPEIMIQRSLERAQREREKQQEAEIKAEETQDVPQ